MNSACGIKRISFESMQSVSFVNEGAIAEQWVGQALLWSQDFHARPKLYYWIREGRSNNAEVDYIIEHNSQVIPVEVKAGASGTLKSIHQFVALRSNATALRFDLNMPSQMPLQHRVLTSDGSKEVCYNLVSLPLYLAEQAYRLLP